MCVKQLFDSLQFAICVYTHVIFFTNRESSKLKNKKIISIMTTKLNYLILEQKKKLKYKKND